MRKSACEPAVVFLWTCGKFDPVKKENRQKLKKMQFVTDLFLILLFLLLLFFFSVFHILYVLLISKTEVLRVSLSWPDVLTRVVLFVIMTIWIFQEGQPPSVRTIGLSDFGEQPVCCIVNSEHHLHGVCKFQILSAATWFSTVHTLAFKIAKRLCSCCYSSSNLSISLELRILSWALWLP